MKNGFKISKDIKVKKFPFRLPHSFTCQNVELVYGTTFHMYLIEDSSGNINESFKENIVKNVKDVNDVQTERLKDKLKTENIQNSQDSVDFWNRLDFWINSDYWEIYTKINDKSESIKIMDSESIDIKTLKNLMINKKLLEIDFSKSTNNLSIFFEDFMILINLSIAYEEEANYDLFELFLPNGNIYFFNNNGLFKSKEIDKERQDLYKNHKKLNN